MISDLQQKIRSLKETGMAVVMAILTVAIIASISSFLLWQQNLMMRAVANQREQAQLYQVELAVLEFVKDLLKEDLNYSSVDHYGELWATTGLNVEIEDWTVVGKITDGQARFNINNLIYHDGTPFIDRIQQYRRLLEILELPTELADSLVDWLDKDDNHFTASGAEDTDYLLLRPPYRAANQPMVDISNLVRVKGYTQEVIDILSPFITALPDKTPINLNTASPEVLAAVIGITLEDAKAFDLSRNRSYLRNTAELNARLPGRELHISEGSVSVNTQYFLLDGYIKSPSAQRRIQVMLFRLQHDFPFVLWRKQL